ncbi:[NiFe]-hydrogenase assembly chaperone HybE [Terasakiella sp. A23]|uniref:[NiFe]-hydrogenase assembly chaperone HybE n=1 Tax=Terasakiella sp. FCG-A23 TaxID=3080561 RepID=UPI0029550D0E|nr:[NiFe]-hydrogenase assembly chaperone HybE [Terasakiella sp. A23]MDV7340268.1 [NiFe]-hydrogenase assembly chaperone HybE [Terasakiella sp. A23]
MTQHTTSFSVEEMTQKLETCFNTILVENMQGINILNHELEVEAIEFTKWDGRVMGMVVTPWFVNLIMLPNDEDDWHTLPMGQKKTFNFPSKDLDMMVNEIEGFGYCRTYSLYSPCKDLPNQESARIAAAMFLRDLLDETKRVTPTYSEEQIARYLKKEDMVHQEELKKQFSEPIEIKEEVNRRDLLRGKIKKDN